MELLTTIFKYLTHCGIKQKPVLMSVVLEAKMKPVDVCCRKQVFVSETDDK